MSERMQPPTELPLHPWRDRLEQLPEGKGNFYYWGPNYTVDPIVIKDDKLLLIQRGDSGDWALPGGFVDPGEDPVKAGLRELSEETNLTLEDTSPQLVYTGPVDDPRSTLHAWPETTALLWRVNGGYAIAANDDAQDAAWVPLNHLPSKLHGSHAALIEQAITEYGSWREQLAYFGERCEVIEPSGGHMGYERTVVSLPNSEKIFIKRHNAARFSDSIRERHSRNYLQKEFAVYRQLSSQSPYIAECRELIEDHTLVLTAYDPRDGWHWRAPQEPELQKRYIRDVLTALKEIEAMAFKDASDIPPAHQSFVYEGWGQYDHTREQIAVLLATTAIPSADILRDGIEALYAEYLTQPEQSLEYFAHTDIRQSNLAWHPNHGVKIVDWSWAGPSDSGLDTTSFLIDLAKSGIDIQEYMDDFNPLHARRMIGFWLGRAILPAHHDTSVRDHQLASAITAFSLLQSGA